MEMHPELGFGIMRMPEKNGEVDWEKSESLIDEYMKGSYCYFDTHPSYMMEQSQRIIREYVVKKYNRERFLLADKMPYYDINFHSDYLRIFKQEMIECGVEYFDYYLLHAVSKDIFEMHEGLGGFEFLQEVKKDGRAKKIGLSFHDSAELLEKILDRHSELDFVQLQINYLDWENPLIQSKACYEIARKYHKPIIVMEPIKGGGLARGEAAKENARLALKFVKSLPGIQVILSGMSEIAHIRENRFTLAEKDERKEGDPFIYQDLRRKIKEQDVISCTECRYCIRECSKGIKIPDIFSLVNAYYRRGPYDRIYGRTQAFYENNIPDENKAGKCIGCGMCEQRCPQKISIRENLKKAANLFEKQYFYTSERNAQILIYLMRQYGIRKVIVSPGATNVSFVYSIQQDGFFELYSAPDERSAAYMACGLAEESGEVVALSCTGATASRNYLPGLTGAYYRNIPVLAITSTQPNIRIGHNIPQVVDRTKIQNDIVKMSVEMPVVKDDEDEWACMVNANKALNELWHRGGGPVHINLVTTYSRDFSIRELPHAHVIRRICIKDKYPNLPDGKIGIFCGAYKKWDNRLVKMVDYFCEKNGAVVICDHTSNYNGEFRCTPSFLEKRFWETSLCQMDLMIHIGNVSGAYYVLKPKEVWRVHPSGEYCDTFRKLSNVFEMDEYSFFEQYTKEEVRENKENKIKKWPVVGGNARMEPLDMPFSNAWIASQTAHRLPENSVLHLGILNSLRTWNFYQIPKNVRVYSNTGGFGIDGCLSTLIGASLANSEKLYFGVMGDLAFFYDMNALGNRHVGNNLRLLVVNNGGGTEFKNYNHAAKIFGDETDLYIAAKGHYGNKSTTLLKDYAENCGFIYRSASSKNEYLDILPELVEPKRKGNSIVVEVFTDSEAESEALKLLNMEETEERSEVETAEKVLPEWLKDMSEKEVILWGCGHCLSKNFSKVEQYCKVKYVCDNNSEKWNTEIFPGIVCISPEELKKKEDIFVVIMLEDAKVGFDVVHQLQALNIYHFDMVEKWLTYAKKIDWRN